MNNEDKAWIDKRFNRDEYFPNVLEVGAGSGEHIKYIRYKLDQYIISDIALIRHNFRVRKESWWPIQLAFIDLNLFFVSHITINKMGY